MLRRNRIPILLLNVIASARKSCLPVGYLATLCCATPVAQPNNGLTCHNINATGCLSTILGRSNIKMDIKQEVLGRPNSLRSLIRHGPHRKRHCQLFFYCWMCIRCSRNVFTKPLFSKVRGFLPSCCLATVREYTYRDTDWWKGFRKHAVEMGSGALVYIPIFIQIDSTIHKLIGGLSGIIWHRKEI
jgi:hypothetical protein